MSTESAMVLRQGGSIGAGKKMVKAVCRKQHDPDPQKKAAV
jgi:hypothetical protein